jgi:methylphosphotriester-DNA--protein-cysteine methyltransferase
MGSPREKIPTIPHIRLAPHRAEPVRDVTLLPASSKHTAIGALEFPNSKSYKVTNAVTRVANRANAIHFWRRGLDVHARPSCKSGTQSLAIERLVRTSRSIKQVARDVGFHNEKSFMRVFKQWTGESPVEYRRKAIPRS